MPGAGPGEIIGHISMMDATVSRITLQKFDLGADGAFGGDGGDADTLLDLSKILLAANFDASFEADVMNLGSGAYSVVTGSLSTTDTTATPVLGGDFESDLVHPGAGRFRFQWLADGRHRFDPAGSGHRRMGLRGHDGGYAGHAE